MPTIPKCPGAWRPPAGLGAHLAPGGALTAEELEVLFQSDLSELAVRLQDSQRTTERGMRYR
eukprot:9783142-Alexandrium_andersonii.AAC.1